MRTSLTSSDRARQVKDSRAKPLTSEFFDKLIKLETDIVQKKYTAETLDELMQSYGQAVEYYDSIKDQISSYFIFKIQDILMTKKALKVLMTENLKVSAAAAISQANHTASIEIIDGKDQAENNHSLSYSQNSQIVDQVPVSPTKSKVTFAHDMGPSDVIMETVADESSDEDDEEEKAVMMAEKQRRITELNKKKGLIRSLASMKSQKQKMFSLQLKLQSARIHDKQNLQEVLSNFGSFSQDNDKVVMTDLDLQKQKIRSKIAKKRKDGLMNFTQSSHGFAMIKEMMDNMNLESVLKGLDDEDTQSQESGFMNTLSQKGEGYHAVSANDSGMDGIRVEIKKLSAVMCSD